MIELITGSMRGNVIALSAHGQVSHLDYTRVVIPAVEERIKVHPKVRLFFHLGEDFTGYAAEAIWDDTKIGIHHISAFERIAVVTNAVWIKKAVRIFGILVPCPVRVFPNEEFSLAAAWVNE